mgnify:CR=1 FL=1
MIKPLQSELLASDGVRHGFFDRHGGVSEGIYASLNCGIGSDDDRAAVLENRRRAGRHLAGRDADPLTCFQIHSATALVVDGPFKGDLPKADALVTRTPGVVVGALAADCAPVLLADRKAGVVAAAHAGWRGAIEGVVDAAVRAMEGLGATRGDIHVAVGPCIGQASYEVGLEFEAAFLERDPANASYFKPGQSAEKRQFDLAGYVADRARGLGLGAVEALGHDVYAAPDRFFSYRRSQHRGEPDYARLLSAIVLV